MRPKVSREDSSLTWMFLDSYSFLAFDTTYYSPKVIRNDDVTFLAKLAIYDLKLLPFGG